MRGPLHGRAGGDRATSSTSRGCPSRANSRPRASRSRRPATTRKMVLALARLPARSCWARCTPPEFAFFDPRRRAIPTTSRAHAGRLELRARRRRWPAACRADGARARRRWRRSTGRAASLRHCGVQAEHAQPGRRSASRRWPRPTTRPVSTAGAWTTRSLVVRGDRAGLPAIQRRAQPSHEDFSLHSLTTRTSPGRHPRDQGGARPDRDAF